MGTLPDDDEPKTWQNLAEAAVADLRAYANDGTPRRRLVSPWSYEERAELLREVDRTVLRAKTVSHGGRPRLQQVSPAPNPEGA